MSNSRPAVFLDRDGTLMEDVGYPSRPDQVRLLPGAAEAVRRLNRFGLPVVVVTNQSGIARGLLTERDFEAVQGRLVELLAREGARLDAIYMCPHHPEIDGECECRKPGAGLYERASRDLSIDLPASYYIGDRWRDVAVSERVGGTPILIGEPDAGGAPGGASGVVHVPDLATAVERMLTGRDMAAEG